MNAKVHKYKSKFLLPKDIHDKLVEINTIGLCSCGQMAKEAYVSYGVMNNALSKTKYRPNVNNYDKLYRYAKNYKKVEPKVSIKVLISKAMIKYDVNRTQLAYLIKMEQTVIIRALQSSNRRGSKELRAKLIKLLK